MTKANKKLYIVTILVVVMLVSVLTHCITTTP